MAKYVLHVGSCSAQGLRSNNEDRYVADPVGSVFLVADGMGGQDRGEQASGLAAEIIPRVLQDRLAARDPASKAMQQALNEANQAIIKASKDQLITYLATIGTLGPMLGLVGTVFGMILAFIELGKGGSPDASRLADGVDWLPTPATVPVPV